MEKFSRMEKAWLINTTVKVFTGCSLRNEIFHEISAGWGRVANEICFLCEMSARWSSLNHNVCIVSMLDLTG